MYVLCVSECVCVWCYLSHPSPCSLARPPCRRRTSPSPPHGGCPSAPRCECSGSPVAERGREEGKRRERDREIERDREKQEEEIG